jgi:hypothetical protein
MCGVEPQRCALCGELFEIPFNQPYCGLSCEQVVKALDRFAEKLRERGIPAVISVKSAQASDPK